MGYGFKHGGVAFNPTSPSNIIDDPTERREKPEPTPLEEPVDPPPAEGDAAEAPTE